ncbi:MAG TPA: pepsin/retropepsin-like aspartic protease family protein [Tepidisphaeraceae bacterium]|nr:pepsin/retropepsin-like aspartic protease family protein [Tepidisphaeraceae bacterium]
MSPRKTHKSFLIACAAIVLLAAILRAADSIEGVQPASIDQPRIYLNLRRAVSGPVLHTADKESASGVEAFLDTGASGIMLSADTVKKLGVKVEKTSAGQEIKFEDTGVAGSDRFGVTEPLFAATARYPNANPENPDDYGKPAGPFRAQIRAAGGLLELISPGMDVAGMPVIIGQVVAMDPTPLAKFDKMRTALLPPGDSRIPKVSRHVPPSLVDFSRFTRIQPAGAPGPQLIANPLIGPDPFKPADTHKPITITHQGKTVSGSFLLDTGAAASMISKDLAQKLGVRVAADGTLPDIPRGKQFELAIGGLGGAKQAHGLFFDRLELPTREKERVIYTKIPLLVSDITVVDQEGKTFTLDGVFGMNNLVASAEITGGLLPDVGKIVDGPFRWIVIDLKQNELGLEPR